MPEWDAEVTVEEALARALIRDQFPELRVDDLRRLGAGWDNTVWLVDGRWAFRFPRRAVAVPLLEHEIGVLQQVASQLPLPVPQPTFIGRPAPAYPWPYVGARFLPGVELAESGLPDADRVPVARAIGTFLRALHNPAMLAAAPPGLPRDPNRRADAWIRRSRAKDRLGEVARRGLWLPTGREAGVLDAALVLAPDPTQPVALTHGDLHPRHLLIDGDGAACGVIDWGDVCIADPAIDLNLAFGAFRGEARDAFFDAYGDVSQDQLHRARLLALFLSATLLLYADDVGLTALRDESRDGLDRAVEP
jgi:aminoglycoside phosphotransferase (APT) family kinase protein